MALLIFLVTGAILQPVNVSIAIFGNQAIPPLIAVFLLLLLTLTLMYLLAWFFSLMQGTYLTRFLAWCGRMSLTLMCTHIYIGKITEALLSQLRIPKPLGAFCSLLAILVLSALLVRVCNQYKAHWKILQYL